MITAAIFPGRYVQGSGALSALGDEVARLGRRPFAVCDPFVHDNLFDSRVRPALDHRLRTEFARFGGEVSDEEVERLCTMPGAEGADVVVGVGGRKTLDAAKATALALGTPVAIVPSIASTDAPCSAEIVIHTPDGEVERHAFLPRNPDLVLVDTQVIAEAPVRTLVAGMGDALATRFEAEACRLASVPNATGHRGAFAAFAFARLCYDTLLAEGPLARRACEDDAVTERLERIVEANTLLSGIGFESGGLATAHALDEAFLAVDGPRDFMHGERVAFGTLASLFLTAKPNDVVDEVYRFAAAVGLPATLAGLGLGEAGDEDLRRIADTACAEGSKIHNEPRPVSPEEVVFALRCADEEGRRRKFEPRANPVHAGSAEA